MRDDDESIREKNTRFGAETAEISSIEGHGRFQKVPEGCRKRRETRLNDAGRVRRRCGACGKAGYGVLRRKKGGETARGAVLLRITAKTK